MEREKYSRLIFPLFVLLMIAGVMIVPHFGPRLPPAQVVPAAKRNLMPDFRFPSLAGAPWMLSSHRGHVVLLNFWATWCPPCRAETPDLVHLEKEYHAKGLDVAGICMDDNDLNQVRDFASQYHIPYPILLPPPGAPVTDSISAYPTTLLIDRSGRIAVAYVGELNDSALRPALSHLLSEAPSTVRDAPLAAEQELPLGF